MRTKIASVATAAFLLSAAHATAATNVGAINGNLLDFTDNSVFSGQYTGSNPKIEGTFAGTTFGITASGTINFTELGVVGNTCPSGVLACDQDGLGIDNDEITGLAVGEKLVIDFGSAIPITQIYLLDLFQGIENDDSTREEARINGVTYYAEALKGGGNSGLKVINFLVPLVTNKLTFTARQFAADDNTNDYAIAAISTVPLPASALLLLGALGGLGVVGRRRRTDATA
jgi:hypothetical protein